MGETTDYGSGADFSSTSVGDILTGITSAASQAYNTYQLQQAGLVIGPQGQLVRVAGSAPVNMNLILIAAVVVVGIVLLKK